MNTHCAGYSLVELLIAMALSVIIIGSLAPINNLGLKATASQQKVIKAINQLQQSVKQIEIEVKSAGSTGCLVDRNNIHDRLFTQPVASNNPLTEPWLAGNVSGSWHPASPLFSNSNINDTSNAVHLMFADLTDVPLDYNDINTAPGRVFYITNCAVAQISRGRDSTHKNNLGAQIYPFQSIIYYVRRIDNTQVLYRQYLNKSGNPRNEPLIDDIKRFKVAYAEATSTDTLIFKSANTVSDWSKVLAIYVLIEVQIENLSYSISRIITMANHNA